MINRGGCEVFLIIIRDADGAPQVSPWHHLVSPIRFALVARHPDCNPDHKRSGLKPWLYAVGVKPFIYISRNDLLFNNCQKKIYPVKCAAYLTGT